MSIIIFKGIVCVIKQNDCCCCLFFSLKLYLTLLQLLGCSPPCSSVHGIFQARILEWIAISSPGDLPNPRGVDPASPALAGRFLTCGPWGNPKQKVHPCLKYQFLGYFLQLPTMDRHFLYMSIIEGSLKCFLFQIHL